MIVNAIARITNGLLLLIKTRDFFDTSEKPTIYFPRAVGKLSYWSMSLICYVLWIHFEHDFYLCSLHVKPLLWPNLLQNQNNTDAIFNVKCLSMYCLKEINCSIHWICIARYHPAGVSIPLIDKICIKRLALASFQVPITY